MYSKKHNLLVTGIIFSLVILACGQFAPPESCNVGGSADESKFASLFTKMELLSQATGQPVSIDSENGAQFSPEDPLVIEVESLTEVTVRACVQSRQGGGKIPFDQTQSLPTGKGSFALGTFNQGSYVVRLVVDGVLVKNLTFFIK